MEGALDILEPELHGANVVKVFFVIGHVSVYLACMSAMLLEMILDHDENENVKHSHP